MAGLSFIISNIKIASYAGDNTSYNTVKKNDLTESLEEASTVLFQWFDKGFLKNNLVKVHLLINK